MTDVQISRIDVAATAIRRLEKIRAGGVEPDCRTAAVVGFDRDNTVGPPVTMLQDQLVQLPGRLVQPQLDFTA